MSLSSPEIPRLAELQALSRLRELPELLDKDGGEEPSPDDNRGIFDLYAHSGMSVDEVYIAFFRLCLEGEKAWVKEQSLLGRIVNRLSYSRPGYVELPGRILNQALGYLNDDKAARVAPRAYWNLRLDLAIDIRDQLKSLAKEVA